MEKGIRFVDVGNPAKSGSDDSDSETGQSAGDSNSGECFLQHGGNKVMSFVNLLQYLKFRLPEHFPGLTSGPMR